MKPEFVTLAKSDPEFTQYLMGTFSKTHRAIPVETYHGSTQREKVTFRIVDRSQVEAPYWLMAYIWSCRPGLLGLTLGPAIAVWLARGESAWPVVGVCSLIALFFLHTSVFLVNDVQDHLQGADRVNHQRGSQVIQKGWVRAVDMKRWALAHLVLAVLFAIPAFYFAGWPLVMLCLVASSLIFLFAKKIGLRQGLCDLMIFLLFGPLLTIGMGLATSGRAGIADIILGSAFGLLTSWVLELRQFEGLFRLNPQSSRTFLGFKSFDWAKGWCVWGALMVMIAEPVLGLAMRLPLVFFILAPMVSIPLILTVRRFQSAASPLSSKLIHLSRWALMSHGAWTLWWIVALGATWLKV